MTSSGPLPNGSSLRTAFDDAEAKQIEVLFADEKAAAY